MSLFAAATGEQLIQVSSKTVRSNPDSRNFSLAGLSPAAVGEQGILGRGEMAESWSKGWEDVGEGTGESQELTLEKFTFCPPGEAGCSF